MTDTAQPRHLDIADPRFAMSSEEVRDARDACWYATTSYGIAVLRYDAVADLVRNEELIQGSAKWPDHHGVHGGVFYDWWRKNLLVLEGEDHHRIRRLLNPAFSPKSARNLAPEFRALARELVDGFIDTGEIEFVGEFAEPFATRALCIMLGIPQREWPKIARLASTIGLALGVTIKEDLEQIDAAVGELYEYAEHLIRDRQEHPGDDLISKLVQTNAGGDKLSDEELRNAIVLLIFGGMDTTRNQLGLAIQSYVRQPDQWELLAERPDELAAKAVNEVMRVNPTTRWVTREASVNMTYRGLDIEQGTTVHLLSLASGQDTAKFENPEIDLLADREPHFGFGGGVHHCLGQHVARTDMAQALPELATRMTDLQIVPGSDEWLPDSGNTGPIRLGLRFRKRA